MPKILIVYDSLTGNTERMAHEIGEGIKEVKGVDYETKKVGQARIQDLVAADGIMMGSPTYYGEMSSKLKAFIDSSAAVHGKLEGKVGAAFTSAGGTASGAETTLLSILQTMLVHGMVVQGRSDDKHYGVACVEAPHDEDLENCRKLGRRTAELTLKMSKAAQKRPPEK